MNISDVTIVVKAIDEQVSDDDKDVVVVEADDSCSFDINDDDTEKSVLANGGKEGESSKPKKPPSSSTTTTSNDDQPPVALYHYLLSSPPSSPSTPFFSRSLIASRRENKKDTTRKEEEEERKAKRICKRLLEYTEYLKSPDLNKTLNESFSSRNTTTSTRNNDKHTISIGKTSEEEEGKKDILDYYVKRPNLRNYTFDTELPRMTYKVYDDRFLFFLGGGNGIPIPLENVSDIRSLYQNTSSESESTPSRLDIDLLFRAANQSILADVISTLSSCDVIQKDLYIVAKAKSVEFELYFFENDISSSYMHVQCELLLNIPGICEFGSLVVDILFHPNVTTTTKFQENDDLSQQEAPMLQMEVTSVKPNLFNEVDLMEISKKFVKEYRDTDDDHQTLLSKFFGDLLLSKKNKNRQEKRFPNMLSFLNMKMSRSAEEVLSIR